MSCGQRDVLEKQIGRAMEQYFANRGFETSFAASLYSIGALTENIFRFPNDSKYFVFIDSKREELPRDQH
jgi:predicted Fe-Mo cluster-binding NifX family protein